jgi:hypothetical protein
MPDWELPLPVCALNLIANQSSATSISDSPELQTKLELAAAANTFQTYKH